MRALKPVFIAAFSLLILGCQSDRGLHTIPHARDYEKLQELSGSEVREALSLAEAQGGAFLAPYDYYSALAYQDISRDQRWEFDTAGHRDFASLAHASAETAVRKTAGRAPVLVETPADEVSAAALFAQLKSRYLELNAEVAKLVCPIAFAELTAILSEAEHHLKQPRKWRKAAPLLVTIKRNMDFIEAGDQDEDGIADVLDLAPFAPEDKDGFEDWDGAPDLDNDKDGIPDSVDIEPLLPETKNRWQDTDGAPDAYPALKALYYERGSSVLTAHARGYLTALQLLLTANPAIKLRIAGHTDNSHSLRYNLDLSRRRAEKVHQFLIDMGADEKQLLVTFHGAALSISATATNPDPGLDRRVELSFE